MIIPTTPSFINQKHTEKTRIKIVATVIKNKRVHHFNVASSAKYQARIFD